MPSESEKQTNKQKKTNGRGEMCRNVGDVTGSVGTACKSDANRMQIRATASKVAVAVAGTRMSTATASQPRTRPVSTFPSRTTR